METGTIDKPNTEAPTETSYRVCTVDGCEDKHSARGYCPTHYNRFRATGTTDPTRPASIVHPLPFLLSEEERAGLQERILGRVSTVDSECWLARRPYEIMGFRGAKCLHRLAFEAWNGGIPEGMEVDHLCCDPKCVNPEHLEAVTHGENIRRSKEWHRTGTTELDRRNRRD